MSRLSSYIGIYPTYASAFRPPQLHLNGGCADPCLAVVLLVQGAPGTPGRTWILRTEQGKSDILGQDGSKDDKDEQTPPEPTNRLISAQDGSKTDKRRVSGKTGKCGQSRKSPICGETSGYSPESHLNSLVVRIRPAKSHMLLDNTIVDSLPSLA